MAKFSLDVEYDYDFFLLGISSHLPNYRLCWAINRELNLNLIKSAEPIKNLQKDKVTELSFAVFCGSNTDLQIEYTLIDNLCEGIKYIPDAPLADYLLLVRGISADGGKFLQQKINEIDQVLTTFILNPEQLKSKEKLLF